MTKAAKEKVGAPRRRRRWWPRLLVALVVVVMVLTGAGWIYLQVLEQGFATGCTPAGAWPQPARPVEVALQAVLEEFSQAHGQAGVQAVVLDPDGAAWHGAAGLANRGRKCAVTADTLLCLGPVSSLLTAAVVMSLVEDGSLGLEDRLGQWTGMLPAGREATIEQVLRQTSGLPGYTDRLGFRLAYFAFPQRVWTPLDLAAVVDRVPLHFPPGSRYEYSSTNALALALAAERAGGQSFRDLLIHRVADPLGLTHLYFEPGGLESMPIARGYDVSVLGLGRSEVTAYRRAHLSGAHAGGGMIGTARDVARFTAALFGRVLLAPETVDRMVAFQEVSEAHLPAGTGFGLGVRRMEVQGRELWGHTGVIPGYTAFTAFSPGHGHVITVLANLSEVDLAELAGRLHREALVAAGAEPRY